MNPGSPSRRSMTACELRARVAASRTQMHVRTASTNDAELLAGFLIAEAREAEGREIAVERAKATVRVALAEPSLARYWIAQDNGVTLGAIEVTREWSDWNGAHYWWIQ